MTRLKVDAIVNVSNRAMKETKGWTLNSAIHKAAGPALARETKPMGKLEKEAVLTGGHNLPSKHVIHVARPGYSSSEGMGQFNQLVDCYRCAFKVAFDNQLKTIAFPCMGTGGVGFPSRVAARIALQEVREYLDAHSDHKLERIIFCVNTAANEQAYIDLFPVYFPPTHDDLEAARSSIWSEDRGAVARQVLDTRNEIQKISVDLKRGLSLSVPDFPEGVLGRLSAMDLALASIRRYLLWSNELNKNLRDLKLVCSVVQLFCGNIAEIIDLAKDHASLGQRSDKSIWDEYVSDMNDRHKMDPLRLLNLCCKFIQGLDHMITRDGVELVDMSDLRQKLERYKVKQRGARDAEGTQDHLNEVLYTREFQRQTIAQSRDTVRLHQIQSMSQLYKLGELEEKPTLAHPSAMFNHTICLAREDITKLEVDVMVNSTDKTFGGIGTLDRTVFLKGGVGLREAVKAFGQGKEGDVRLTGGYLLPAKHLLHIIPPELYRKDTKDILRKIYREILHTAVMLRATSIALPSIGTRSALKRHISFSANLVTGTGMLNYPRRDCASLALEEVKRFLESAEPTSLIEKIIFVVYSSNDEFVYKTLLPVYFPPIDLNINRALPASITRQNTSATTSSEPSETPRRALFGSVGEALRSVRFGKLPEISRPITANEEHALICFESHAKDCKTCNDVTKLYLEGRDLCKDGYSFAQTVLLHMNMQSDQNVYTKPDIKGQSVRLEIPGDMYPISMSLLALVEKSYRDGDRSRPFVTPNRPYGAIVQDQRPDITAFQGIPRRARAHILTKSQAEDQWTAMASGECQIKVYPSQIFISELDAVEGDQTPLVWLELDASALVQRHMTTPEVTLVGATRLQSNLQTKDDVLFRCRNDNECNSLLRMIRRALDDLIEGQAGIPASTGEHEQRSTDDYPKWNQRIRDISEELASVKRVTGGLTDLQFKMERLGAATSSLSTNSPQASAASKLYDASRSLLATRVLVCLTADIKSRPGSYIGLGIDSIVSALRSDRTKVLLALKELEAEDQVHNTVDTDTWVVTHLPKDLPVLSTEQIETASQQVSFSRDQQPGFSQSEAKHATYVSGGTAGTSNIGPPAYIHDKPRSHRIEPPLSLLATWIVSHIPFETTSSNELVLFREIASRQKTTVEEVERAMAEVQAKTKWFYDSDAPTSPHLEPGLVITASYTELNLWTCIDRSIVDPGILREIGVDFEDRGSDLLLHRALEKGELVEWTRRTREARQLPQEVEQDRSTEGTSATVIRDTPSFTDTPPSPIAGPSTSSTDQLAPLHLDTINIDDFFSYSNPPGTRWTRVDKRLIDASVLIAAEEEYEDVGDSLIVHRVLRRGEIRRWAEQSREVREALVRFQEGEKRKWEETSEGIREVMRVLKEREGEGIREEVGDDGHSLREASGGRRERRDDREVKGKGKDERDEYQERLDRVIAGDMKEEEMRRFADRDDERYL
jgi:O-acetyl-ADP-ribose deacetylase (regulator of RNase III)